jgi:GntR family transcriptional regulator/MocR family aminotransferase
MTLDRSSSTSLSRQIYDVVRSAILSGQLPPDLRLPSSRALAAELGLSRSTTLTAYERLRDEGYLDGRVGAGTTVARLQIPEPSGVGRAAVAHGPAPRLSTQTSKLATGRWAWQAPPGAAETRPSAFPVGRPALDAFPADLWSRVVARRARHFGGSLLGYQHPAGYRPLREAIAAYLGMARGVRCTADQVIVVAGAQSGLSLAARVLLDPGDTAWVEDPGYYGARAAIVAAGARPLPVTVDADGINVEAACRRSARAAVAYVTPSHQFPLGVTMSLPRRLALLEWARATGMYIVEDDYDSEYRYVGDPLPSLQGLDTAGRVIYVGSFSKVLFPALRIGYIVVPDPLIEAFVTTARFAAFHVSTLEQGALTDFIADGHFARHIRRMRALYARRGATLVDAIRQHLGGHLEVAPAHAGLHLIGWLRGDVDDARAAARAAAHGVEAQPLSAHAMQPYGRAGLLLGYAATPEPDIVAGVRQLAAALSQRSGRRASSAGPD